MAKSAPSTSPETPAQDAPPQDLPVALPAILEYTFDPQNPDRATVKILDHGGAKLLMMVHRRELASQINALDGIAYGGDPEATQRVARHVELLQLLASIFPDQANPAVVDRSKPAAMARDVGP